MKTTKYFQQLSEEKKEEIKREADNIFDNLIKKDWSSGEIEEVGRRLSIGYIYFRLKNLYEIQ